MYKIRSSRVLPIVIGILLVISACSLAAAEVPATATPQPTAAKTLVPTKTPTRTPLPTRTPNLTATQRTEDYNAEVQKYFELGYIKTTEGGFVRYKDFKEEWAQLDWIRSWALSSTRVTDFFISAHLEWSSAYRNADISGCGFYFAFREGSNFHYKVILDRSKAYFMVSEGGYLPFSPTRGTGLVNFENPADQPVEADFTLIVNGAYAYVLVNGEVIGEYTLSRSRNLEGYYGASLLSGTNKDFGTRCEMTNIHAWIPNH